MTGRALSVGLCAFLLLALGCTAPDISGSIGEYVSAVDGGLLRSCDCAQLFGYSTIDECTEGLGQFGAEGEVCIAGALEGQEEQGREFLDCAAMAQREFTDCIVENSSCEESVLAACTASRDAALDACPSGEVRAAVEECAG